MKERFIKALQVTRKIGFIMAAIMVFPYVSNLPAVMASDGTTGIEAHEVSIEDLEKEYEKELLINQAIEEFEEEYSKYISIGVTGEIQIDYTISDYIDEDELEMIEGNIAFINSHIKDGTGYLDDEGNLIIIDLYDDFVMQAGTTKINKIRWNYIDFDLSSFDAKFFKVMSWLYLFGLVTYSSALRQAGVSITKSLYQAAKLIVIAVKSGGSIVSIVKSLVAPVISLIILTIAFIFGKFLYKFAKASEGVSLNYGINVYWKFIGSTEFLVTR